MQAVITIFLLTDYLVKDKRIKIKGLKLSRLWKKRNIIEAKEGYHENETKPSEKLYTRQVRLKNKIRDTNFDWDACHVWKTHFK